MSRASEGLEYVYADYHFLTRCVRRIPEATLALLERSSPDDHSVPQNITRLKAYISPSVSESEMGVMGGIGDIPIGEGDGWTCQPFPYQYVQLHSKTDCSRVMADIDVYIKVGMQSIGSALL